GRWLETIARVESQVDQKPEVEVALLGGTGAGKSTLVNAVSGVRLLPVNSMRVTTAAITEVSYQADGYTADIEFVDRTAWLDELELIAEDVFDQRVEGDDGEIDLS